MTNWRNVGPNIREIHAFGVQGVSMTTIVFDIAATMPARLYGRSNVVELSVFAFGKVEQAVVAWIEPTWDW